MSQREPLDRGAAAIGWLTVIAANFLYLAGLPLIIDPMMSMEPFYIHLAGLPASTIADKDPAWGPLYALWLKPFVGVFGDPLAVYTANVYGLSLAVSSAVYLYVLLLTRRAALAAGAALFFLISDLNVPLASKASAFALMLVLAGLSGSELVRGGAPRMTVAMAGVLLAAHVRPELYPAALCLWSATVWLAYRESRVSGRHVLLWPAGGLAVIALAAAWIGTPIFSPSRSGDRMLIAFREHFAWNWSRWHGSWRYFGSIWQEEFGSADSTVRAFANNPGAFTHHVLDNLLGTVRFLLTSACNHYPLLVPATWPTVVKLESLALSAALLGALALVVGRPRLRAQMHERYGHVWFPYAAISAFSIAAAVAIYPLGHYLMIPAVLLILLGVLAVSLIVPTYRGSARRIQVIAALACLAAVPRPFVLPSAYEVAGSPFKGRIAVTRTVTDTVAFVRSLQLPEPVHVLTVTDGIGELLGPGFQEIKAWQRGDQSLEQYIRDQGVDAIVTLEAGRVSFAVQDPFWELIQTNPAAAGFTVLPVPNQEHARVYVRSFFLERPAPPDAAGN